MTRRLILTAGIWLVVSPLARGQVGATLFQQGNTRLSIDGGYGSFKSNDYLILGLGAGYYVWNGLEAGVDGDAWIGSKPHIYEASPRLTYVFYQFDQLKPYIGGFYRRTLFDTLSPLDSAGGRVGVISLIGERTYLSAGLVFESYFHCDDAIYDKCSLVYPELGLGFSF